MTKNRQKKAIWQRGGRTSGNMQKIPRGRRDVQKVKKRDSIQLNQDSARNVIQVQRIQELYQGPGIPIHANRRIRKSEEKERPNTSRLTPEDTIANIQGDREWRKNADAKQAKPRRGKTSAR